MAIKQKDIKLLWGRAGNRCSICRTELSYTESSGSGAFPVGEHAHIVAEQEDGPRGQSILTREERDSYANLFLLCPTHHGVIDKAVTDYPTEKLHLMKTDHELWVRERLSAPDAQQDVQTAVYSHLVDQAATLGRFECWERWGSAAMTPQQILPSEFAEDAFRLRQRIAAAVWPGTLPELERSLATFSKVLLAFANVFMEHARKEGERDAYRGEKFYNIDDWDPPRYERLSHQWDKWTEACDGLIREATRAANWVASVVRRELNPMFYALEGKFFLTEGPDMTLSFSSHVYEYSEEEGDGLPDALEGRFQRMIGPYREASGK